MTPSPMFVPDSMFAQYNPRRLTVAQAVAEVAAVVAAGERVTLQHDLSRQVRGVILTAGDMRAAFAAARAACAQHGISPYCITRDGCNSRKGRA